MARKRSTKQPRQQAAPPRGTPRPAPLRRSEANPYADGLPKGPAPRRSTTRRAEAPDVTYVGTSYSGPRFPSPIHADLRGDSRRFARRRDSIAPTPRDGLEQDPPGAKGTPPPRRHVVYTAREGPLRRRTRRGKSRLCVRRSRAGARASHASERGADLPGRDLGVPSGETERRTRGDSGEARRRGRPSGVRAGGGPAGAAPPQPIASRAGRSRKRRQGPPGPVSGHDLPPRRQRDHAASRERLAGHALKETSGGRQADESRPVGRTPRAG